jgi:hypothetical protein
MKSCWARQGMTKSWSGDGISNREGGELKGTSRDENLNAIDADLYSSSNRLCLQCLTEPSSIREFGK